MKNAAYAFERCTKPEGTCFWICDPWSNRIAIAYSEAYARLVVRALNHLAQYVPLEPLQAAPAQQAAPVIPPSAPETRGGQP